MRTILNFMNGRFGNRVLNDNIIIWWRIITWGVLFVMLFKYVTLPLFERIDRVVNFLNYVIWG